MACGISVPPPRIKPIPAALEAQILNHWTAEEVPIFYFLTCFIISNFIFLLFYAFTGYNQSYYTVQVATILEN